MLSLEQLEYEISLKQEEDLEEYLENFFDESNLSNYYIDERVNEKERKAIESMFENDLSIMEKAESVLDKYPLCIEAYVVCYCLEDETTLNIMFNETFNMSNDYESFSEYEKECYIDMLEFYVAFLLNIDNRTVAIKVQNKICELEKRYSDRSVTKLAYMYALIEDDKNFYDLYLKTSFNEIHPYILLIVVLLKHEDEIKAKEVLNELISKFKYASYIDHVWELENNNEIEAVEFKDAMEICFDEICSVPYFFSWCSDNKELTYES